MKTTARSITLLGIFFILSTINAFGQKMDKAGTYLETIGKEFKWKFHPNRPQLIA